MRIDNDGEGGIVALMSLLGVKRHRRPLIVLVGLFGAALIYGDGAITFDHSYTDATPRLEVGHTAV
jgi:KUP system potassium uptake protein